MATVGEALAATIDAQWNVGTGGTKPSPIQYLVEVSEKDPNPTDTDAVFVYLPIRRVLKRFNSGLRDVTYEIRVVCHTITSSARQTEIENEVDRIISSGTVITGATRQDVLEINDFSDRAHGGYPKYMTELIVEVFKQLESSATAYGTATTTILETDEFTVNSFITGLGLTITDFLDEDDMASDSTAALASQQSVKAYVDQAIAIGIANAVWTPAVFFVVNDFTFIELSGGAISNTGGNNIVLSFRVPLSTNKTGLKLNITKMRVILSDADGTNYIDQIVLYGIPSTGGNVALQTDNTNRTTSGTHTTTFGAAEDVSSYSSIMLFITGVVVNANALDIKAIQVEGYYDT